MNERPAHHSHIAGHRPCVPRLPMPFDRFAIEPFWARLQREWRTIGLPQTQKHSRQDAPSFCKKPDELGVSAACPAPRKRRIMITRRLVAGLPRPAGRLALHAGGGAVPARDRLTVRALAWLTASPPLAPGLSQPRGASLARIQHVGRVLRGSSGTRPRPLTRGPAAVAAPPARRAHRLKITALANSPVNSATRLRAAWRVAVRAPHG